MIRFLFLQTKFSRWELFFPTIPTAEVQRVLLSAAKSPPGFVGCSKQPGKMAEAALDLVSFDKLHGIILDSGENILEDLNEEEQLEVENVVTLLESVKDNSLEDFETDENNTATN